MRTRCQLLAAWLHGCSIMFYLSGVTHGTHTRSTLLQHLTALTALLLCCAAALLPHRHWVGAAQPLLQLLPTLGACDAGPLGCQHGRRAGAEADFSNANAEPLYVTLSLAHAAITCSRLGHPACHQHATAPALPPVHLMQIPVVASNRIGTEKFEASDITFYGAGLKWLCCY